MKQRFSSIDVRVLSLELAIAITSLRISNIYDLSSRIFLLKLQSPGSKQQLLIDSGFRCHLTSFARTTAAEPSPFVKRLRKYLKSRRVTGVRQIGTDRVIELDFSGQYKLYLEFFAAGNIILTDAELNVLALLRQVNEGDEDVDVRLGSKYVLEAKQNYNGIPPVSEDRARTALEAAAARIKAAQEQGGKMAKRAKSGNDVRKALSNGFPEYPAHLLDVAFFEVGADVSWSVTAVLEDSNKMAKVMESVQHAEAMFNKLQTGPWHGYIVAKLKSGTEPPAEGPVPREALLYEDFHPFRPGQLAGKKDTHILEIEGFNAAVDDFYSSIESQKLSSRLTEREDRARQKIQTAKDEHEKRLGALQHVQETHIRKAQAIEVNTHRVEEACAAVNGLISQGMDWADIAKLIEGEQSRGNVVAQMIKLPLKLNENTVTLLLEEAGADDSDSEPDVTDSEASESEDEEVRYPKKTQTEDKRLAVDVDLALSPWSNARQYYDQKKVAAVKEQKTLEASSKALKSTERKIQSDLARDLKTEKPDLRAVRQLFWFEKFLWFISSDGYLVLSGKDGPQSQILYERHLRKGDIYVHADVAGANPVIVKNRPGMEDSVIPPGTLSQAGAFCICGSSAWDSKAVMSAWWVTTEQVSRVHEATGELVQGGGVSVKGKKNWLPPSQLLLGFGLGWLVTEESRKNHGKLRVGDQVEQTADDVEKLELEGPAEPADVESDEGEDEGSVDGGAEIPGEDATGDVPDVEDAAGAAEQDVGVDATATKSTSKPTDAASPDADSDRGEDDEPARSNPLQATKPSTSPSNDSDAQSSANEEEPTTSSTRPDTPTSSAALSSTAPIPRGKRAKAKRVAAKYAHQDSEDRALAMELLGGTKAEQRKAAEEEARRAKEEKAEKDRERRRAQHERAAQREKERAERLAKATAEGGEGMGVVDKEEEERERKELESLDRIVPALAVGDEVFAAVPVCAPWSALGRHKYKVKLQPGAMKKGKMVREVLGGWAGLEKRGSRVVDESNGDKERVWRVEVERLKGLRDVEVLGCVPVKGCRVVQGGGILGGAGGKDGGGKSRGAVKARGGKGGKKR